MHELQRHLAIFEQSTACEHERGLLLYVGATPELEVAGLRQGAGDYAVVQRDARARIRSVDRGRAVFEQRAARERNLGGELDVDALTEALVGVGRGPFD